MSEYREFDFNPYSLPQQYTSAIGLVVACAAQTEITIEMAIAGCLDIDAEFGMAVTTHMTMPQRFQVLAATAELKLDDLDQLDLLDEIISETEPAFAERNKFIHNQLAVLPDDGTVHCVKSSARGSVQMTDEKVDVEEILAVGKKIYLAGERILVFLKSNDLFPPVSEIRPRFHKLKAQRKKRRKKEMG